MDSPFAFFFFLLLVYPYLIAAMCYAMVQINECLKALGDGLAEIRISMEQNSIEMRMVAMQDHIDAIQEIQHERSKLVEEVACRLESAESILGNSGEEKEQDLVLTPYIVIVYTGSSWEGRYLIHYNKG